jgi:hypothetical protein
VTNGGAKERHHGCRYFGLAIDSCSDESIRQLVANGLAVLEDCVTEDGLEDTVAIRLGPFGLGR